VAGLLADRKPALHNSQRPVIRQQSFALVFGGVAGGHRLGPEEGQGLEVLLGTFHIIRGVTGLDVSAQGGGGVQVLALGNAGGEEGDVSDSEGTEVRFRFGAEKRRRCR